LNDDGKEIKLKHDVDNTNLRCNFIVISNLGIMPKETDNIFCNLISKEQGKKLRGRYDKL
jgi:hypothetical protein